MVYIIVVEFPNGQGNIWEISPKIPFVRCFRRERERRREEKVKFEAEQTDDKGSCPFGRHALFSHVSRAKHSR